MYLLERNNDGIAYFGPIRFGNRLDFAAFSDRVRRSHIPWSAYCQGPDLLQNLRQGGLLLGARPVDVRSYCEYYHDLHAGIRRVADSKAIAATRTMAKTIK